MAVARSAVVGGFVLGAVLLGVTAIIFFGGRQIFATTSRAAVFFEGSVAGLDVGAPVTFRGVRVGEVHRIGLRFSPDTLAVRIPVILEIDPHRIRLEGERPGDLRAMYRRLIAAGLRAQLVTHSWLTGQVNVDLDFRPGTPDTLVGVIPDLPEIPAVPPEGFDQLRVKLTELPLEELVGRADHALATLDKLGADLDAALPPLADDVHRTATSMNDTLTTATSAIRQMATEMRRMLGEVDQLAGHARHQIDGRGDQLEHVLAEADRVAQQAETLLASLNGLATPRGRFRGDLEAALRDLADSANSLRSFTRTLERDPSALLTGRAGP